MQEAELIEERSPEQRYDRTPNSIETYDRRKTNTSLLDDQANSPPIKVADDPEDLKQEIQPEITNKILVKGRNQDISEVIYDKRYSGKTLKRQLAPQSISQPSLFDNDYAIGSNRQKKGTLNKKKIQELFYNQKSLSSATLNDFNQSYITQGSKISNK